MDISEKEEIHSIIAKTQKKKNNNIQVLELLTIEKTHFISSSTIKVKQKMQGNTRKF